MYGDTARALDILLAREDELFMVAQNLIEFWAVATRPIANNGLGLTIVRAAQEITKLKALFANLARHRRHPYKMGATRRQASSAWKAGLRRALGRGDARA